MASQPPIQGNSTEKRNEEEHLVIGGAQPEIQVGGTLPLCSEIFGFQGHALEVDGPQGIDQDRYEEWDEFPHLTQEGPTFQIQPPGGLGLNDGCPRPHEGGQ